MVHMFFILTVHKTNIVNYRLHSQRANLSIVQDILKDAIENNIASAAELPYFEGDFWPGVLEESIKELETEEEEKRRREEAEAAAASQADIDDIGDDSNDAADMCSSDVSVSRDFG